MKCGGCAQLIVFGASRAVIQTPEDRKAAEDLLKDFEALRRRCEDQLCSLVTPMGWEMSYRYQEWPIEEATGCAAKSPAPVS
jgi:hypothetical protein